MAMVGQFLRTLVTDVDEAPPKGNGMKFVVWVFAMYFGLKGLYSQFNTSSITPFCRDILMLDSVQVSEIQTFRRLPWSMKPAFAMVSDIQPIWGYKKRFYVFFYALVGTAASICLIFLPIEVLAGWQGRVAALLFFSVHFYVAGVDCLTQGRYTTIVKYAGAGVVTFVFFNANFAQGLVLGTIGPLNDINPRIPMMIAFPFGLQMFIFASLNWMGDEKKYDNCSPDREVLKTHSRTMILALVQLACSVGLMVMTLWKGYEDILGEFFRLGYVIFFSIVIISCAFWALPRTVAKCNAYLYLCKIMQLSAGSALTFFYTKPRSEGALICDDFPNFDYTFYQTYAGIVDKVVTLLGIALFQRYIRHWDARPAFWITTFLTCLAGMFDIMIVQRWNRDILGVSDSAAFLFGSACIEGLVETLDELPATLLMSKLCPKDVETTVFAILVANVNLGGTIAGYVATDAQKWLGVQFSSTSCENPDHTFAGMTFTGLSWILIIGDIILPLLTIPLTFLLIPAVKLDSDFSALDGGEREIQMGGLAPLDPSSKVDTEQADSGAATGQSAAAKQIAGTTQEEAETAVLTASFSRSGTRQNGAEMM